MKIHLYKIFETKDDGETLKKRLNRLVATKKPRYKPANSMERAIYW